MDIASPKREPVIMLDDITLTYAGHPAVRSVSGSFEQGSMTAIAGPNGAGKSTLLKAVMGELRPARGSIDRGDLAACDFAYLPQAIAIDRQFPISVLDAVMLGAWRQCGAFGRVDPSATARIRDAMKAVGLEGFDSRNIGTLSAGQFQRVLFARLLVQDAQVIILDEPFTAIDARTTKDLLNIIRRWHNAGRTIIAVLHDFEQVHAHFPETLLLAREVIEWGPTEIVMSRANLLRARVLAERWSDDTDISSGPHRVAA